MALIPRDEVERVREAVDWVALVEQKTELRRSGPGRMMGRCPFHDERTPSFSINVDDKLFHCFGCGVGGDLFEYVQLLEGVDFGEAIQLLADRSGIEIRHEQEDPAAAARRRHEARLLELLDRTARFYERQLWETSEGATARIELERRGLNEETLRAFRVGYAPQGRDPVLTGSRKAGYTDRELLDAGVIRRNERSGGAGGQLRDRFYRRIMFPLADRRGRILGFGARAIDPEQKPKYINSSDGVVYHKGRHVYAAHVARAAAAKQEAVILCEGYTDVIALHQAGIQNVVGLMGTALTKEQIAELGKLAPTLILALDGDSAGRGAMLKAGELARGSELELRVAALPDGSDPADLLGSVGADGLRKQFAGSVAIGRFHVQQILDASDLSSAEGKDKAIDRLRPVISEIPEGVLRMELVADIASRMDISPSVVEQLLPAPGPDPRKQNFTARPSASSVPRPAVAQPVAAESLQARTGFLNQTQKAELRFLAECKAANSAEPLTDERIEKLFSHPVHSRAALALRDAIATGGKAEPADAATGVALDHIARIAMPLEEASVEAAQLLALRLELAGAIRAEQDARANGQPSSHFTLHRLEIQRKVDEAIGETLSKKN